ncbi:hypothetical protein [Nocardia jiangsuensis]|uniref:Minor tail protein n=1 Tax=Nocardia jiangsuensis TaxID=1691563 RepID=A0ABV8DV98_9NOCA
MPFLEADLLGTGALLVALRASVLTPGAGAGAGQLTAVTRSNPSVTAHYAAGGTAVARTAAGPSAIVLATAGFDGTGAASASDAAARGSGELSATTVVHGELPAAFHGVAAAVGIIYSPPAPLTAALTGQGALTAAVTTGFSASGMNKNGAQAGPNTMNAWIELTGWTADTGAYPGSTVTTNKSLVSQGSKVAAVVSGSVSWTSNAFTPAAVSMRLKLNDIVIATGTVANPATASATVTVANGDRVSVEIKDGGSFTSLYPATVNAAGTFARIT